MIPLDGEPFAGELVSIDAASRLAFRTADDSRSMDLDEFVRWSHPPLPGPQTLVLLGDGSRLVTAADWSGGAAVRLEGETLVVRSDTFGGVRLPKSRVCALVFANHSHPRDRQRLEDQVRAAANEQDQIWLTNQDRLGGKITELPGGSLTLATDVGDAKLPLSRIEAIVFGGQRAGSREQGVQDLRPSSLPAPCSLLLALDDGSLLHAARVEADGSNLDVRLAGTTRLAGGTVNDVASLQSLRGRFVYLSDLEPAEYRHVPYLDIQWPYHRDRNALGQPLSVNGKRYLKGLGMHSAARLTYRLDGGYRRFDAAVAIDDSAGGRGSVALGVYVLRDGQWQAALTSGIVRGGDEPQDVSVDITGAQALTLTVDYADHGDELDHADWLDAHLTR